MDDCDLLTWRHETAVNPCPQLSHRIKINVCPAFFQEISDNYDGQVINENNCPEIRSAKFQQQISFKNGKNDTFNIMCYIVTNSINIKEKPGKMKLYKMLKRREECDTYLTRVCRHHWSRETPVER